MSKDDWLKNQSERWVAEMRMCSKYEDTPFSHKTLCLFSWLKKKFRKISIKQVKSILYDVENQSETVDNPLVLGSEDNPDEGDQMEVEYGPPGSPDMFMDSQEIEDMIKIGLSKNIWKNLTKT